MIGAHRNRRHGWLFLLPIAITLAARPAAAQHLWNNPAGGSVAAGGNWLPATVPGASDTVTFGAPLGVSHTYTANFPAAGFATDRLVVRDDDVTINLGGGTYSVLNNSLFGPSGTEIGTSAGDDARLTLLSGALQATNYADIAVDPGSMGEVVVSTGATWNLPKTLRVGRSGSGSLVIENGGDVVSERANIGAYNHAPSPTTSVGSVMIRGSGSSWTNTGPEFTVGFFGQGSLTVENQGSLTTGIVDIGTGTTATGVATIDGEGSIWTVGGSIFSVGYLGSGELHIQNGGDVTHVNTATFPVSAYIRSANGLPPGAGGRVTVDGPGSTWTLAATNPQNTLEVGDKGTGDLDITASALVSSPIVIVGSRFGTDTPGTGTVVASSSGRLDSKAMVIGFDGGSGTLNVIAGGEVTGGETALGFTVDPLAPVGQGQATVSGADSSWNSSLSLIVGARHASGTFRVENGAHVTSPWVGAALLPDSSGTMTVAGSGSLLEIVSLPMPTVDATGRLHIGGFDTYSSPILGSSVGGLGGAAQLSVESGGAVTVADLIKLWAGGSIILDGGTITVGAGPAENAANTLRVRPAGTLAGDGTIQGNVANDGLIAPGTSTGILTVDGDYAQSAEGTLLVELAGGAPGQFDALAISGAALVDGTLDVDLSGGFVPQFGDAFGVIASPSLEGTFQAIMTPPISFGLHWTVAYNSLGVVLTVATIPGDVDGDADVDIQDFLNLQVGYGTTSGARLTDGDLSADGDVDFEDFMVLQANYGAAFVPGDVDGDHHVDIQDFLMLQAGFGITSGAQLSDGDCDGDGDVDIQDFLILQANYGADTILADHLAAAPWLRDIAVPEPSTITLVALGAAATLAHSFRQHRPSRRRRASNSTPAPSIYSCLHSGTRCNKNLSPLPGALVSTQRHGL